MSNYNPNSTGTLGMEWLPTVAGGVTLDGLTSAAAMSVLQTTAQVTANEKVWVGAIPTRGGLYAVEVYDNETGVLGALTTLTARPNEDVTGVSGTGGWQDQAAGTSNIYTSIDEATVDLTDYILTAITGNGAYTGRMNTGGLSLTGLRILAVRLVIVGRGDQDVSHSAYRPLLNINSVNYLGSSLLAANSPDPTTVTNTWYYNPATKKPWTIADVQTFDTTDEWGITTGGSPGNPRIYQAYMEVVTATENRLAAGVLDDTSSGLTASAWNTVAVLTPTGGAWTKDGAGRHLYVARRLSSTGSLVVPTLAGSTAPNPARGFTPTIDPTYGYITAMGSATPAVFGLVQRTSAPADSVDSQPYTTIVEAKVYNGQTAQQQFSNAAVAGYGEVRALVKPNSATGNLLIKVKRQSDNVQFGSTITWTPAQVAALADAGSGWKLIDSQMASVGTLAAATQYYIEFSDATAADDGTGSLYWSVNALDVGDASTGVTAGFGGTTDIGTVNGSAANRYDLPTTLSTIPTAPAGFTATVQTQTF